MHRIPVPIQHDGSVCGLTSLCYAKAVVEHVLHQQEQGNTISASPKSKRRASEEKGRIAVSKLGWGEVEALRRAAITAWRPDLMEAAEAYTVKLTSQNKRPTICSSHVHVVFDLYDEDDDEFDEQVEISEREGAFLGGDAIKLTSGNGLDGALYDFLQAVGLANLGKPLGDAGSTLEACVVGMQKDRTAFLAHLRDTGVTKLADRQAFANALAKAARAGWLRPPYKGPFTELGRELRQAREAQPNAAAPQIERPAYGVAAQYGNRPGLRAW